MSRFPLLPCLLALFFTFSATAQELPKSWSVSPDGRMLKAGGKNNTGFYRQDQIREVALEFSQTDWWRRLLNNYASNTDLTATCWIDGIRYDSVGVRFKGKSSFRSNDTEKKSFNITLDHIIDGQDVDGYNTFNLNGGWEDSTSMREVLYNNIGHHYSASLKANFVSLKINGEDWGPYANVQQPDSDYIKEWYLSNDGTIWRAQNIDGGTPGAGIHGRGKSTLNFNGPDSTDYTRDYLLRRTEQEDPWAGLIAACDVLNNTPLASLEEELARVLDIDKACWFLAHEIVFADSDSYVNKGGSDYFLYYEPETGRMVPVEYDGNGVLLDKLLDMRLFFHSSDRKFPLLHRMLAVPEIRQRYLAHVRVILEDYFNPETLNPVINGFVGMIDILVQEDPKKFYTYEQFQSAVIKLKEAVRSRNAALLNEPELMGVESLTVNDLSHSVRGIRWQSPTRQEEVNVVAGVGGNVAVASVWLHYGSGLTGPFTRVRMHDDGLHDDGAANDGLYGAAIPPHSSTSYGRYYVAAIAADEAATVSYAPRGAEHDVYLYEILRTSPLSEDLVINELMAANESTQADQDGEFDDWIELYNTTNESIPLDGFYLSDDADNPTKWVFPAGTTIAGNGYLMVWADADPEQDGLHAEFKLSAGGESVYLFDPTLGVVDSVTFGEQETDISHGRFPNGTGGFWAMDPTFNTENNEGTTEPGDPDLETSTLAGKLVINEFMAANETTRMDQDGEFDDWIELRNNAATGIALDGFYLTDDIDDLTKWAFPAGTFITADGHLVIWADEDLGETGLHANFKLSAGGEILALIDTEGKLVDTIAFAEQETDISHGRFPDGTGEFISMTPTFNVENNDGILSNRYEELAGAELTLFPNPTAGILNVRLAQAYSEDLRFQLKRADGRMLREVVLNRGGDSLMIDTSHLPEGFYLLSVTDGRAMATRKVVVRRYR